MYAVWGYVSTLLHFKSNISRLLRMPNSKVPLLYCRFLGCRLYGITNVIAVCEVDFIGLCS